MALKIGTRGSPLALAQAYATRELLVAAHNLPEEAFEIVAITTSGDRIQDSSLSQAGGKGLFTKELEEAIYAGYVNFAVHSSKDMQTQLPDWLEISAFLPREDARDAFISRSGEKIADLPEGSVVGSASLRRQALILRMRPDLKVTVFRGNVETRLRKLGEGMATGTILAHAGLLRLGLTDIITDLMPVDKFPPAPGQGAICIESRVDDVIVRDMLAAIDHKPTGQALACERAFLTALDGSCRTPIAGYAEIDGDRLSFLGLILTPDGTQWHEVMSRGQASDGAEIGREAGAEIMACAGKQFFERWS